MAEDGAEAWGRDPTASKNPSVMQQGIMESEPRKEEVIVIVGMNEWLDCSSKGDN